jgi:chemotaxis-related protein WspB
VAHIGVHIVVHTKLFVLFELGVERYALDAGQVAEVLPLVHVKPIPQAPPGVAGVLNYHGAPVPVIDLSAMLLGRAASGVLSTRIILARYADAGGEHRLLGLIAERTTRSVRRDERDFVTTGLSDPASSYLGPVAADADGIVQWIRVQHLLSASVRAVLFQAVGEAP